MNRLTPKRFLFRVVFTFFFIYFKLLLVLIFLLLLFPGSHILLEKLKKYKPKIAVFNGKLIYEVFSGKKEFGFGRQPSLVEGTNTVSH